MDAPVQQQSLLAWMFNSLGAFYAITLPLVGLLLFLGAVMVVVFSRRPSVIASFLVFLPLPWLIGVFGAVQGAIGALQVIGMSSMTPKPSEVAEGIAMCLFCLLVGILVSFPSYFVLSIGLFIRTVFARSADGPSAGGQTVP